MLRTPCMLTSSTRRRLQYDLAVWSLRFLVALGIFVSILTGWFSAHAGRALLRAPAAPVSTTVAAAPADRWVTLEDAVLDCANQRAHHRAFFVLAYDRAGAHPFVAKLAGPDPCQSASPGPIDGAFISPSAHVSTRDRQGYDLAPGSDVRLFDQFQAPRFLRGSLTRWLVWFGLSLLLTALAVRALWIPDAPAAPPPPPTKSGRAPERG
jgi:hypothetical protein